MCCLIELFLASPYSTVHTLTSLLNTARKIHETKLTGFGFSSS